MKRRFPKFAFVLLTACSSLAFASCGKGPAGPTGETYKFYQFIEGETVHNIGDDYYGIILSEDYLVITLYNNGSVTEAMQNYAGSSVWTEVYSGTWTNEGINYTLTLTARDGEQLTDPLVEHWTLENDVFTEVERVGLVDWTYILHKA